MKNVWFFFCFIFAALLGHAYGFRQGVESSEYDRVHANEKLQQCLGLIYEK